jgi:hypothetical protein
MLSLINVVAGISWEPEIRGALVVLIGSAVLFGSVWLILATNIGSRVGTLTALASFFGWLVIMGLVWWIYGGNVLRGEDPAWVPEEGVFGPLDDAVTGNVSDLSVATLPPAPVLVNEICPGLVDATVELQRDRVVENNLNLTLDSYYSAPQGSAFCQNEQIGELLAVDTETLEEDMRAANEAFGPDDPRFLAGTALDNAIDGAIDDEVRKVAQLTLSSLFTVSPELVEAADADGSLDLVGWNLVSNAEAGEAQATAAVFLTDDFNASPFQAPSDFIVRDTFQQGGKPKRASDSTWDRVRNEVRNTVVFWHPENTTVVQVVGTLDKPTIEGQAPPFPEVDPSAEIVSVVMVRDLGSRRLPAALITIGSLIIFIVLCWMLHIRDVELRRRVAEWDPAAAN